MRRLKWYGWLVGLFSSRAYCTLSTLHTLWYYNKEVLDLSLKYYTNKFTYIKNRILTNLYKLWKFDMILDRKDCHFFHVCINMKYCKMNNKVVIFSAGTSAKLLNIIDECRRSTRVLSSKLEKKSAKLLDTTELFLFFI